jgi:hypothetical protein
VIRLQEPRLWSWVEVDTEEGTAIGPRDAFYLLYYFIQ